MQPLLLPASSSCENNTKSFVIPELKEWKGAKGSFILNEQMRIVYPKNQPELARIANANGRRL